MDFDNSLDIITPDIGTTLTIGGTGALVLPSGTTAQRPSATNGIIRYNSDTGLLDAVIAGAYYSIPVSASLYATSISAAGSTQGTATAISADVNNVTTVASSTGVILPSLPSNSVLGRRIYITNNGANTLNVYPQTGASIDALSANTATTLVAGKVLELIQVTSTLWETASNTGVSGGSGLGDPGSNGIVVRTSLNTTTARTLTGPAAGITVTNGDGTAGNPTLALANDLSALEALNTNGILARTATDTWAARTITGTANQITVTNGDGISDTPTLSLPSALTVPGSLNVTTSLNVSTTTGISAAGSTQGTATAITADINIVSTVASSTGVILPTATVGRVIKVANTGANTLNVYPASGASIDALASNAATTLAAGAELELLGISTTNWGTELNTGVSGGGATITDDTTTNATYYPGMSSATSGTWSTAYTSSTKLTFNPSTGTLSATVFTSLSDQNYKDNIETINDGLSTVGQIRGVSYNWKDTKQKSYGVVAQEIEKVLPELISATDDGKKTVNYSGIIGFLISAIQELEARLMIVESTRGR